MKEPEKPDETHGDVETKDAIEKLLADESLDNPESINSASGNTLKHALMRTFFIIGIGLLASAFIAGVSEAIISRTVSERSWFISARDLWRELNPESLLMAKFMVRKYIAYWLWDPAITGLLGLPAWLLLGGPGMVLVWKCNPNRDESDEFDEDSLYLYDLLAEAAKDEGYEDDVPQMGRLRDEDGDGMIDSAGITTLQSPDEFADDWSSPDYDETGIPK